MTNLYFEIPGMLTLEIRSDRNLSFTDTEYLLLRGYVPGIIRMNGAPQSTDLRIEHVESKDTRLIQEENRVSIFDTWNGSVPADLYHLAYALVRTRLLKRHVFTVHGACVGKDRHVLIVGHSGAGKTSVLLKLLEESELAIFSGNKTAVSFTSDDRLRAVAGTPTITIRGSDIHRLDELNIADHIEYGGRYAFTLSPDRYTNQPDVPLDAIVIVKLNDWANECTQIGPASALHTLYPYFLDAVNSDVVLSTLTDAFVGTPPHGTAAYLVSHLKTTLSKMPVYSIIGSASFVTNKIAAL